MSELCAHTTKDGKQAGYIGSGLARAVGNCKQGADQIVLLPGEAQQGVGIERAAGSCSELSG